MPSALAAMYDGLVMPRDSPTGVKVAVAVSKVQMPMEGSPSGAYEPMSREIMAAKGVIMLIGVKKWRCRIAEAKFGKKTDTDKVK